MVIPKQDTFLCIADRSLSRLRGSPLPGAGCLGPVSYVGGVILTGAAVEALSLAQLRLSCRLRLRRLWPPVRFGVGCAAWVCAGRLVCVSRRCVCPTGCSCGGFAAGARLGWLCRLGLCWALRLCLAWVRLSHWMRLRRLCRLCAFGLAVPLGIGLSAWHAPRVGALVRSGAAAAAMPPGRIWVGCAAWDWAGCLAIVSRGHV